MWNRAAVESSLELPPIALDNRPGDSEDLPDERKRGTADCRPTRRRRPSYILFKHIIMEPEKILRSSLLDIVFEGKNKEYGAYELRVTYNRRMLRALLGCGIFCLLIYAGFVFGGIKGHSRIQPMNITDVVLQNLHEEKKIEPPVVLPPKQTLKVATVIFTKPKIEKEVKPEERPPEQAVLEQTKIGTVNQQGLVDDGITAPPIQDNRGVAQGPAEDYEKLFTKVEIESSYPGGEPAWARFLLKNFQYPEAAAANGIQGVVMVQFIVDREGNVSEVQAVSGPTELRAEAVRVIRKSGLWVPAEQNGRHVKSYKQQSIRFVTDSQ